MKIKKLLLIIILLFASSNLLSRSVFRLRSPLEPSITARWQGDNLGHTLVHSHLQEGPYFNLFDQNYFFSHLLPSGSISFRNNPDKTVTGKQLSLLVEELLQEVEQKKTHYRHFTILKRRDFNTHDQTGLIIAKFNDYPFVLKIFIETPKSFVEPLSKGFETTGLFLLGGGITRHLSGFTRIKNLERLQKKVQTDPYWSKIVEFPRKWYWLPQNPRWMEITGKNMGPEKERTTTIPAIYGLICDYIQVERMYSLLNHEDRKIAMQLSNFLEQQIDPHINNYAVEKETKKIVPIDTEHFPTMVGYDVPPPCNNYVQWYCQLGFKMIMDTMTRSKAHRRMIQARQNWPMGKFD